MFLGTFSFLFAFQTAFLYAHYTWLLSVSLLVNTLTFVFFVFTLTARLVGHCVCVCVCLCQT